MFMTAPADELKKRLIKDYLAGFQTNQERMEELRRLMSGEMPGDDPILTELLEKKELQFPGPKTSHQVLLRGIARELEIPNIQALPQFNDQKKKPRDVKTLGEDE